MTTLEERRKYLDMVQTYKIVNRKENVRKDTWFEMASTGPRTTRQAADPLNIRPQAARLDVRRNFFSQRVVSEWNSLPAEVKKAPSIDAFKRSLKSKDRVK